MARRIRLPISVLAALAFIGSASSAAIVGAGAGWWVLGASGRPFPATADAMVLLAGFGALWAVPATVVIMVMQARAQASLDRLRGLPRAGN